VNRIQIQQVLLNLIRNGLKAMKDSPRRQLVITSAPASNGMVRVSVADTGSGIAPDVAARLFQSFVTTKKSGWALAFRSTNDHRSAWWTIAAEPNPGGGTIFRFIVRSGVLQDDGDRISEFRTPAWAARHGDKIRAEEIERLAKLKASRGNVMFSARPRRLSACRTS
jgi:hypothetical protein